MTEALLPWFSLGFAVAGCLAAIVVTRGSKAATMIACASFVALMAAWVVYGYGVTGDVPTTPAQALAHVVLYGFGLLLYGGLPFTITFSIVFVPIMVARRKNRESHPRR